MLISAVAFNDFVFIDKGWTSDQINTIFGLSTPFFLPYTNVSTSNISLFNATMCIYMYI